MRPPTALWTIGLLLGLAACAAAPTPATLEAGVGQHYGAPFELAEPVALAIVGRNPPDFFERTLLVEAEVVAVCERAGCWMKVQDGDAAAMVRWESGCGGRYAFPRDAVGKRVRIQGSFYSKQLSDEDAAHLESEAGGVTIERRGYELNASAVWIPPDGEQRSRD